MNESEKDHLKQLAIIENDFSIQKRSKKSWPNLTNCVSTKKDQSSRQYQTTFLIVLFSLVILFHYLQKDKEDMTFTASHHHISSDVTSASFAFY